MRRSWLILIYSKHPGTAYCRHGKVCVSGKVAALRTLRCCSSWNHCTYINSTQVGLGVAEHGEHRGPGVGPHAGCGSGVCQPGPAPASRTMVGLQLVESKTKFSLPNSMGKLCSFQVILTWQLRREIAQLVVFI